MYKGGQTDLDIGYGFVVTDWLKIDDGDIRIAVVNFSA